MSSVRSRKTREPFPRFLLPTGVGLALMGAGIIPAHATCSTAGTTVTCSGVANPLAPSYANSANNLNVTVNPGASVGVLLGVGGTAMSLTGNNNHLTNNGTIDPSALGSGLGVLSSGAVVGNASASLNTTVVNNGTMNGSTGVAISGVTGMALSVQNGTGGTSTITNTGTIGSNPLVGATLSGADAPVVAAYGGGQVQMTNSGTINGRVSFGSNGTPGQGNTFTNSGTINGGVSMGANSNNTFTAVTGSSVNAAGGTGGAFNITVGPNTLNVAQTGIVDGGAGGNNTLVLQQGTSANGTIAVNNYINFNHLNVNTGNWTINGASTAQDATLGGGVAIINDNASLGTGTITATGGALQAGTAGLNVANNVTLTGGGLTVQGSTGLTLSGTVSGGGALTKNDGGTLTLTGANNFTGGTNLNGGGLVVGNNTALGTGDVNVNAPASLDSSTNVTLANTINLANSSTLTLGGSNALGLSGGITGGGALVKNGAATVTLTGTNNFTGGTTINAGTLAIGAGGSLSATGTVNLANAGAVFDIAAGGAQTIGALTGAAGTNVNLGGSTLTLAGSGSATYNGAIGGTGGLTLTGTGTQTLNGASNYTGGTNLNGGTLILGNNAALGSGALNVGGAATLDTNTSLSLNNAVNLGTGAALTLGGSNALGLSGPISGGGGLVKNGTATTTLTGANTYTGTTTINAGTLALGDGGSFASTSAVNLAAAGAALDLGGATGAQSLGALSGVAGTTVNLGGNALTLGGTASGTFGGTISGSGSLTLAGTGTQTLTGVNVYTGGTNLNSGTVVLGNNGALGNGAVNVGGAATLDTTTSMTFGNAVNLATGASLALGGSNALALSGTISGGGGLVKNGAATTTLTGANNYTGGTTINAGTLALGEGGSLASTGAVNLAGTGATFDVSGATGAQTIGALSGVAGTNVNLGANALALNGNGAAFGGTIAGAGGVTVASGTQVLTGSNTYTGGTTIAAGGTLQLGNGGTSGSVAGDITNNGALVFNQSGNVTVASILSGTGSLTQAGSGQLTLTGTSTLSGPTTVGAGTLAVNGSLAASTVTVQGGGTVTGTGTIGGLVVVNGGTASLSQPGQALNVAGNVTFQPGSTMQVAMTPQQSGSLAATGSATLNGGNVQVIASQASYQAGTQYTIMSAGGGVQGQFASVSSTYAFVTPTLSYDPNHVYLQLSSNGTSFMSVATTPNEVAVAQAIASLKAGNAVYDSVLVADAPTARTAFRQLDGEFYASAKSMLMTDSRYVRDAVSDRVRQGLAARSGPLAALSSGGSALCDDTGAAAARDNALPPERRLGSHAGCVSNVPYRPVVWGQGFGGRSRLAGDGNAATINRSMTGFIAGADMALDDRTRVGLAASVTHGSLDNDQASSASLNSYSVVLYGGAQFDALGVRGGAAYTWHRINADRHPSYAGFSDSNSARYDANTAQVFGEVGYALSVGRFALEPFAGLAYVRLHTNAYTESGGAAALRTDADTSHVGFSTLGVRAATELGVLAKGTLTAHTTAGWRHAFGNVRPTSTFAFAAGSTSFQVAGVPIARDSAVLELGVDASVTKNLTLGVSYSGQFGSGVRDNAVLGNILWKF
ncbi:autotransporter domain-containing protein [Burkholderia ubonensis]|uniref:autotransporter domain-containing protein n=1 Tax=Burkholderia ubonensis TaxID=101571 RepID=UPI0007563AB3|nr:autotransporter domain-containing protein [Burkholderia ubonensis]KWF08630.1 autotransporter outer membrane beta-barrel domain-containing protein [Burkholderia ubonensis]